MFTGLIQGTGTVVSSAVTAHGRRIAIDCGALTSRSRTGDSISVDGVCLTVVELAGGVCAFDVIPQTLSLTTIEGLRERDGVNLELALRVGDPIGGHLVQGHVDFAATVHEIIQKDGEWRIRIQCPPSAKGQLSMIVAQGSVAVSGVSLTVAGRQDDWFEVALIPETLARTTLRQLKVGARVNVEVDAMAKLIDQAVARHLAVRS